MMTPMLPNGSRVRIFHRWRFARLKSFCPGLCRVRSDTYYFLKEATHGRETTVRPCPHGYNDRDPHCTCFPDNCTGSLENQRGWLECGGREPTRLDRCPQKGRGPKRGLAQSL